MKIKPILIKWILTGIIATFLLPASTTAQADKKSWSLTPFEIKDIDAVKGIIIAANVPVNELSAKMGEMYGQLFAFMQANNLEESGAPFAVYYSYDPEGNSEFETGIPVASAPKTDGSVEYKEYTAVKALATLYTGSYDNFMPAYMEIMEYIEQNNIQTTGVSWEVYLTDPEQMKDPNLNQTMIYFPIKE